MNNTNTSNETTRPDSRFFPGYIWVSGSPECRVGLCFRGHDERAAAEWIVPRQWHDKGEKTHIVYTMIAADVKPTRHVIIR